MDNDTINTQNAELAPVTVIKTIGEAEVGRAEEIRRKYKTGKEVLENKIIANEQWYKLRHWQYINSEQKDERDPVSAWLFNTIANKHADAMDNIPSPVILPREESDKPEAKMLSSIVPVIHQQNGFEDTYDAVWWYKLKHGCGVYQIVWDNSKLNGVGDIAIRKADILNLFWEPGVSDIQESPNFFSVSLRDNDELKSIYPELADKLGGETATVAKYIYDDNVDTSEKSVVVDWYYKRTVNGRTILHFCKYCNGVVLFATENEPDKYPNGLYEHGRYPFVFDVLFPVEGSPCGFGYVDICRSPQEYVDVINRAIKTNAIVNASPRYMVRKGSGLNREQFLDTNNPIIEVESSDLSETSIRQINGAGLSSVYVEVKRDTGDIQDTGLPDWTDGYDISDYIDENELDYDGIVLDEGGDMVNGKPVSRGLSYVVRKSAQIKSAAPVTYDDNGNIIPLSERFKEDNPDIRYSLRDSEGNTLSKQQAEYFKESKIRDEDGNLLIVYHGSDADFTVFDKTKGRSTMDIQDSFFSPWELDAGGYGGNVRAFYLNIKNPAPEGIAYKALNRFKGQNNAGIKAREYLESLGYDGVNNGDEEYIAFNSNQIKEISNTSPTSDADIRYSLRDTYDDTQTLAKDLKKELNSSLSATELNNYLSYLVTLNADVKSSEDYDAFRDTVRNYADAFVESSNIKEEIDDSRRKELAMYFKGKKFRMTPDLKAEVEYQYGSYQNFHRQMFGRGITFSKDARYTLDDYWSEICAGFPEMFDETISDKDQPQAILDAFEGLKNTQSEISEDEKAERAQWLADKLVDYVTAISTDNETRHVNPRTYTEGYSDRELLANALDSVTQNELERNYLSKYRKRIDSLNEMNVELAEVRSELSGLPRSGGGDSVVYARENLQKKIKVLEGKINAADKRLLNFEATKALKAVAEREKLNAMQKAKQEGREALKDYRENRKATEIKKGIDRVRNDIIRRLLSPTDGRYVPPYLVKSMIDVCNAIDLDTGRLTPAGTITKAQQQRNDITKALNNLRERYENLKDDSDSDYSSEYDAEISKSIGELASAVDGKPVREMTNKQLYTVYDLIRQIRDTLVDATQQIGLDERISNFERGMQIIDEQRLLKGVKKNIFGKYDKFIAANALNPIRNIRRMTGYNEDSQLSLLFDEINRGVRKADKFTMEAYKAFEELTRDKDNAKSYESALNDEMDIELTDIDGKPVKMSKMVAMQLYLSWQREAASNDTLSHLQKGGAIIPDFKLMSKGEIGQAISAENSQRIEVYQDVINKIYEGFNDFDKAYLKAASDFFNGKAQKAINETMRIMKHRDIATSKNYIPFKVDQDYVVKEITDLDSVQQTLTSLGMLKDIKANAGQPLVMTGLNNVLKAHIDDTARIYGLAIPVRNFNKVWNIKSKNSVSVKEQIKKNWGAEGTKVIEQTIKDIQGRRPTDNGIFSKALNKMQSAFVTSALNNNISVAIKQAASLYTVYSEIDWRAGTVAKFFKTAKDYKKIYSEIDEHTAQHWKRRQGLSTQELGDIAESVTRTSKFLNKIPTALNPTKWIQGIDCITTATFWEMCKSDVEKHTELEVGSEKYWQAVTDMYDQVIEDTQPMYDTLHRPEVQKTTNALVRQLVMFRTQPLQNTGILYDAYGKLKAKKAENDTVAYSEAKREFAKAATSQFTSALVFTVMTLAAGAALHKMNPYRDDDDELTAESVSEKMLGDMVNTVVSVLIPIGGSELETFISNLSSGSSFGQSALLTVPVVDFLNDFIESVTKIYQEPSLKNAKNLAFNFTQLFGIPAKNAYNIINGAVLHVTDAINGEFGSFEAGLERSNGTNYRRAIEALMDNDTAKYQDVIQELSDNGVDGDKISSGLKSKIRDYVLDGEISRTNAEKWLTDYCGDDEAHWTVEKWEAQRKNGKDFEYNKYLNLENAIMSGKPIDKEYSELVNNGVKEDSAVSKVKSFAIQYYLDGKITKKQALAYYGKYLNKTADNVEKSFNSSIVARYRNQYQDGKIDSNTLKNNLVKNGMDAAEAASKVRAWDFSENYTTNADWSEDTINRYYSKVEPYGISVENYDDYLVGYKDCHGEDRDGDGKTDSGSKKVQVLAVIDALPITASQKDALYYLNNWSAKTIYEAPWH